MSVELPEGMKPWAGGDAAPADYDGGKVLSRGQGLQYPDRLNGNRWGRQRTHPFFHEDEESCDIIAYTPMNPHQKPQEDVVVTQEDADLEAWFLRRMPDNAAWRGHIARLLARHRLLGHEAGRRDMREAAGWQPIETAPAASGPDDERVLVIGGPFAEPQLVLPDGDWWRMRKSQGGRTFTHWMRPLPLPTEPLRGEGSPDNSGPE